jgi:hypothetical protein
MTTNDKSGLPPRWLWRVAIRLLVLLVGAALALVIALAAGWNDPRPADTPDWEAPKLPLRIQAGPGTAAVRLLGHPCGDCTLEVGAVPRSLPDFNGYGLIYRAHDEANYTVFAIGSDGYYAVLRMAGGSETPLIEWQQFPHVRRGQQANLLRVTCARATCRFYINDEYAATVEDDTRMAGDTGVWVRSFEDEAVVADFTAVRVWMGR